MRTARAMAAALILILSLAAGATPAWARALPTQSGAVAWGADDVGQLGTVNGPDRAVYGGVAGLGSGVTQVSAGYEHGLALKTDGTVWAWGGNNYGELGAGTNALQSLPVQVPGLTGVTQVAAGSGFELALRSDGTVWAWGCNTFGQLGIGMEFSASAAVPVQVPGLKNVIAVTAGYFSAAVLERRSPYTTQNSVLAWGYEAIPGTDQLSPVAVQGIGTPLIDSVSAGDGFFVALGSDGSVWAWGRNYHDNLGLADVTKQPAELRGPGSGITQVSAGLNYALALRSDGTVLAWGDDTSGQLGDGTTSTGSFPVQVSGLTGATQVAAGNGFSLAVQRTPYLTLGTPSSRS